MTALIALIAELAKLGVGTDLVSLVESIKDYVAASGGTITAADLAILDGYKDQTWASHLAQALKELGMAQTAPASPPAAS